MNEWALVIQTFRLSEHIQGPKSSENGGTTVDNNRLTCDNNGIAMNAH